MYYSIATEYIKANQEQKVNITKSLSKLNIQIDSSNYLQKF